MQGPITKCDWVYRAKISSVITLDLLQTVFEFVSFFLGSFFSHFRKVARKRTGKGSGT